MSFLRKFMPLFVILLAFGQVSSYAQEMNKKKIKKIAERRVKKMTKAGYEFEELSSTSPAKSMERLLSCEMAKNEDGTSQNLVLELTVRHEDLEIARDLVYFKLPKELSSKISTEIEQIIESELIQSNRYWELGGHEYFLGVQQAIDEVALATALNLAPKETIYKSSRKTKKGYEVSIGLIYDQKQMFDLFNFQAGDYEILDSIFWMTRDQ
ncbi:MAG: hypothetical protein O2887_05015 [Bacteroidetes bacterium]|nr:hypothetical protein [Bacteroidota bacterium]